MRSGSTPLSTSHTHASRAVLPPPMIVYPDFGSLSFARSLTGISVASGSTENEGVWVAGSVVRGSARRRLCAERELWWLHPSATRRTADQARRRPSTRSSQRSEPVPRQEMLVRHSLVVVADLRGRRALIQPCVVARIVDRVGSEHPRVHAVEGRGLMEANKRI